jgi:membrane-associated phospholipid phosphatase
MVGVILDNKGLKAFFQCYFPFLIAGLLLIILLEKGDMVLWINKYSKEEWDGIVSVLTNLGLGEVIAGLMVTMAFVRIRYAIMGLFNLGLVGIFTALLKNIFADHVRPLRYFHHDDFYRFIYSADTNYLHSFPSGHAMAIFAAMSLLAYFSGKRVVGFLLFFVALIVGMTRIYLCQHFFIDVYFGFLIGLILTLLTIWIGDILLALNQHKSFQKPIYRLERRKIVKSLNVDRRRKTGDRRT